MIDTRFKDAGGAPLCLGDTVGYTDELGRRYIGVIELPIDYGQFMIRLISGFNTVLQRWEDCAGPVTVYRLLAGCGKRALSRRLNRAQLIARKAGGRAA